LASGREVNFNGKNKEGKTAIDIVREKEKEAKLSWEDVKEYEKRKENCTNFMKILESFERNPNETRVKLRIQLGLAGKINLLFLFEKDLFFFQNISNNLFL